MQDLAILSSYFLLNRVTSLAGPFSSHRDWFPVQANSATAGVHWGFSFVSFSYPGLKSADRSIILIAHSAAEKEQWISRVGKQLVIGRSSVLIDDDYDWSHIEACKAASHDPNDPGDCTCILDLKLFQGTWGGSLQNIAQRSSRGVCCLYFMQDFAVIQRGRDPCDSAARSFSSCAKRRVENVRHATGQGSLVTR